MHSAKKTCIFPAFLVGAAVGFLHYERMTHKKKSSHHSFTPMMVVPKGMEQKAKVFVKEAKHLWQELA